MTAAKLAKQYGCKSLSEVSRQSGISLQTLYSWHDKRPEAFRLLCLGIVQDTNAGNSNYRK